MKLIDSFTAIAFSGTIGIGIFVTSGELISLSGALGCVIAYICAGGNEPLISPSDLWRRKKY
jgi:uncharacterized membrane protein YqgA involved in biofilm formation